MDDIDLTLDDNISQGDSNHLSETMKANLKTAFSWMKAVGIIQISMIGIIILFYLYLFSQIPSGYIGDVTGPLFLMVLLLTGAILLCVLLIRCANHYEQYMKTGSSTELEACFNKQKTYWVIVGILMIIAGFLYLIAFMQFFQNPRSFM